MTPADLLDPLAQLAYSAGQTVMKIYNDGFDVEQKADKSVVTKADRDAEAIIMNGLAEIASEIPVLAEEAAPEGRIPELGSRFFLVDPLDGTREFVNRTGEFTINIGLSDGGRPVAGVVYAPVIRKMYLGASGAGAYQLDADVEAPLAPTARKSIEARDPADAGLDVVASRSHRSPETDAYLEQFKVREFKAAGSSLKFCLLAAGEADLYPRLGRTMEWDTAAGQAVLEAAGGSVVEFESGAPLRYGKVERGFDNPHFLAFGKR